MRGRRKASQAQRHLPGWGPHGSPRPVLRITGRGPRSAKDAGPGQGCSGGKSSVSTFERQWLQRVSSALQAGAWKLFHHGFHPVAPAKSTFMTRKTATGHSRRLANRQTRTAPAGPCILWGPAQPGTAWHGLVLPWVRVVPEVGPLEGS